MTYSNADLINIDIPATCMSGTQEHDDGACPLCKIQDLCSDNIHAKNVRRLFFGFF
jgi:hypothetical protein